MKSYATRLPAEDLSKSIAEIEILWGAALMQVIHLDNRQTFSIGDEGCDLFIPHQRKRILLQPGALGFQGSFYASDEGMATLSTGECLTFQELSEREGVTRDGERFVLASHRLSLVELSFGALTLRVRPVFGAKPILGAARGETSLSGYLAGALMLGALFLGLIFAIDPEVRTLELSSFESQNQLAKFMIAPEKEPLYPDETIEEEESPEDVSAGVKGSSRGENEGSQGKKSALAHDRKFSLKKKAETSQLSKIKTEELVKQAGLLKLLTGSSEDSSPFASVFGGDSASWEDDKDVLGGLLGPRGESEGGYGTGIKGVGLSGGRGEMLMGVGKRDDNIGFGRGFGVCGCGRGSISEVGFSSSGPEVTAGKPRMEPSGIDPAVIRRVIHRAMPGIKYCYDQALERDKELEGRVKIFFVIDTKGAVIESRATESVEDTLGECVAKKISQLAFPAPLGGGIAEVTYPFTFQKKQ